MAEDLFLPVQKLVTQTQGVTLQSLVMRRPDAQSAGVVELTLAPLDEAGEWAREFQPLVIRREDARFETDPAKRLAASAIQQLVFSAVCSGEAAQALGVEGLSVWEAAKVIIAAQMQDES